MVLKNTYKYMTLVFVILVIVSDALLYKSYKNPVTFNLKRTYTIFLKQVSNPKIPKDKRDYLAARFPVVLSSTLKTYAKQHGVVIYTNGAVIAGAKDITADLQRGIARKMYSSKVVRKESKL